MILIVRGLKVVKHAPLSAWSNQVAFWRGLVLGYESFEKRRAYRVPPNFKFPGLSIQDESDFHQDGTVALRKSAQKLLKEGQQFLNALQEFCDSLDQNAV